MSLMFALIATAVADSPYFTIEVIDAETKRGVPLVELTTTNDITYITDSQGIIAFYEPGLMETEVFFHVKSHGYEVPKDMFGYRGVRLTPKPEGHAEIEITRLNVAERLYRVTGEGVYRDTILVGGLAPVKNPVINGLVTGQDTVITAIYNDKLYWFWGDTNRPAYPLGNFSASGATSELPANGGLDPSVGVDLTYFVDENGFSKKMLPIEGGNLIWLDWMLTLPDDSGRERLIAKYAWMKSLGESRERGLALFNDATETFERWVKFDLPSTDGHRSTHPIRVDVNGDEYLYFTPYWRFERVLADFHMIGDLTAYESFTCLTQGSDYDADHPSLDRASDGSLVWGWKTATAPITLNRLRELIDSGRIKVDESWIQFRDIDTGERVGVQPGSIYWNEYRQRWVLIGFAAISDTRYAEADTPTGPWAYAKRIVHHDQYSFYNPTQHVEFDQDGGKTIYFEGTYTNAFSGNPLKTPRYDYNQIMYRLNVDDRRLALPVPVYRTRDNRLRVRPDVAWDEVESSPFCVLRQGIGDVALYDERGEPLGSILSDIPERATNADMFVPIYADSSGDYVTEPPTTDAHVIGYGWRNPIPLSVLDRRAAPR
ncbi:MAG: hypothetical protein O3A46_17095 [Candidatus Poribacteria bacterium]|nr:hypothetical protein [Candidatus Poribacteria bacterium]